MPYGEAVRLTTLLTADPSSYVCAAAHEWSAPVPREWLILADVFDVLQVANWQRSGGKQGNKPKPYPRPFRNPDGKRRGRTTKSRAEVLAILRDHGHNV